MPKSRKKQARLGFTPLPSSSPASKGYNKQIRDRAANVSLEGRPSPAKRRRVQDEEEVQMVSSDEDDAATMPTPATSLKKPKANEDQAEEDSDDMPIRSSQRRATGKLPTRKSRAKQQRLDFTAARDPDSFDTPIKLTSSSSKPPKSSKAGIFSSQANGKVLDISSDESDSDSNGLPSPRKLLTRSRKAAKEKEKEEEQRGVGRPKSLDAEDDDSDEITVSTTRPQPKQTQEESEDEDDEMPTTLGTQRRKARRAPSRDSFISDSPPPPAESDDDLEIIERPSRKRRREASRSEEEQEEEDEDVEPQTPSRRRLKKQPRQISKQEQDDLAEDLDFLGPSSDAENSGRRSSQSKQKNARQQALDRLKQKRSGKLPQVEEEEEQEEGGDENDEEDEVQEISDDEVQEVPQYTSSRQFFKEDDEDADFLVDGEDEEEPLGIPDGIPIEFTRYASMKGKELFKFAVDWMVQYKINPSFKKDDPLYKLTFQKLGHEVYGLAGSKYISSAWTPGFTVALQSRPVIAWQRIDRSSAEHYMRDKCDACNRSGHPAKYEIQFQGLPYDPETLEELQQDDDSSSDDDEEFSSAGDDKHDDDAPDWDLSGREVVPISTVFYVGKFCKANAETAHGLQHWKITLKSIVDEWLTKNGLMTAAGLEKREGWKTKKKRKYANKIVDRMEKDGEIKELWRHWKENIEQARDAKTGRFEAESP